MDTQESSPRLEPIATAPEGPPEAPHRRFKPLTIVLGSLLALVILAAGFVGVAKATDSPTFCGSACHEMGPYHTAWSNGAHKNIACVQCHVDPSLTAQLQHKFVALRQLIDHVKGAPSFPLATAPDVPDSRCVRCHQHIVVNVTGFSHADHANRGPCIKCHADAGHDVTTVALKQAGILNVAYLHTVDPTATATPGGGKADIVGHITVACSKCHDMAAMTCATCHTPGANHTNRSNDCTICHAPGPKFVFTHPQRPDCVTCHTPPNNLKPPHPAVKIDCTACHLSGPGVDWKFTHPQITTCGDCHARPANLTPAHPTTGECTTCHKAGPGKSWAFTHPSTNTCQDCHSRPSNLTPPHPTTGDCTNCHHNPGGSWAFSHPSASADCTTCHTKPAATHGNRTDCPQCHVVGVTWTFSHPSRGASCADCHSRPANHHTGTCATCHKNPGKSWAFTHPAPGATCADCHNRPSNHASGSCQNCHRNAGKNWVFTHPSLTSCSSCHTPPSNHYGTNCGSCHVAGTTWQNVHFNHPKISAPHGIAGRTCAQCHPNGPPAYFCTCHGNTTGPSGD
jgi:hypothetical protein